MKFMETVTSLAWQKSSCWRQSPGDMEVVRIVTPVVVAVVLKLCRFYHRAVQIMLDTLYSVVLAMQ